MKNITILKRILLTSTILLGVSCTNLEEEVLDGYLNDNTSGGNVNTTSLLKTAYRGLRDFQSQDMMFALDEITSDAIVGPTRGGDWDDNGQWRELHTHTWSPDHVLIKNSWNSLLSQVYNCNQVVENSTNASEIVEARFLRAFYYYNIIDLFGQVPYRPAGSRLEDDPLVWTRSEATAFVISELEAIISSLPARVAGDPSIANADAGHFLLAKLYLNKGVFDSASSAGPYAFSSADMTKVVTHVESISGGLASNYWDNFAPQNNTSNEILFTSKNVLGDAGNIQSRWRMATHYAQVPSGWNGFATVSDYYSTFNSSDARRSYSTPDIIKNFGNPIGFQEGQMYKPEGMYDDDFDETTPDVFYAGGTFKVLDRIKTTANPNGQPLIYTSAVSMITEGLTLESAGVRPMKYQPDINNIDAPDNDYVLMRYSDALLMKAEAIARGGSGSLGTIAADLAARTNLPAVDLTNLDVIYAERGRELWHEGWRRNDMVRFGTYLNQRGLKPYVSASKYVLFPIPADALFNANLKQNPGY